MDSWIYIADIDSINEINSIHCDTRDFHCKLCEEWIDTRDGKNHNISKVYYNYTYQLQENELIAWLKEIESMSGGKAKWRMLSFNKVRCDGWLKYIRCYRNPKNPKMFIVCNRNNIPINWQLCQKETLDMEYLNAF